MPPRGIVFGIVVFWLSMTCWLIDRELLPRWRSGEAPAFAVELTDEIGSPQVEWHVFLGDRKVGRGLSHIRYQPDRTFELTQQLRFDDLGLPLGVAVKRLDAVYGITREGRLLRLTVSGAASVKEAGFPLELAADLSGEVVDGHLEPTLKFRVLGAAPETIALGKVPLAEHGSFLNPMQLLHRLPRLRAGQTWNVPLFDPTSMFSATEILGQKLPVFGSGPKSLSATVFAAEMTWNGEPTPCLRVDYSDLSPGVNKVIARTWVREGDGIVLAQEAQQLGYELSIRRVP